MGNFLYICLLFVAKDARNVPSSLDFLNSQMQWKYSSASFINNIKKIENIN